MADRAVTRAVDGAAAHDSAVAGAPVLIGAEARANEPTEVSADGDAVRVWADRKGRVIVAPHHPNPDAPDTVTLTTTTETALKAAPGAGLSTYVTSLVASNTSATATRLDIKDGSTVRYSFLLAADGGGFVLPLPVPWKLAANAALNVQLSGAVTDVRVTALCFVAA